MGDEVADKALTDALQHLSLKDEIVCPICQQEEGARKFFTAPCEGQHKFHLDCIFQVKKHSVGHFKCPVCRIHLEDTPRSPRRGGSAQSTQEETVFEASDFPEYVDCCNCDKVCAYDYNCDVCEKPVCRDCLIKKNIQGGRVDYCPTCVKFFGRLYKIYSAEISAVLHSPTTVSCKICTLKCCEKCHITNDEDYFCMSCVNEIYEVYREKKEDVKDALLRKATRLA